MAKFYDVQHGSESWSMLRIGRPTSSDFDKIMTEGGKPSKGKGVETYANRLIAEIMLLRPIRTIAPTFAMERGTMLEPQARESYEFIHGEKVEYGGFITDDQGHYGCSPDGLVKGKNAGVEFKCPLSETIHVGYLINPESLYQDYRAQVQGQIFVAGFDYVDMLAFHPDLPPVSFRAMPDIAYQENLKQALSDLRAFMNAKIETLIEAGHLNIEGYTKAQSEIQPIDYRMAG